MPLNTKELFFQNVLDNLPGDLVVLDDLHHYVYLNPSAASDAAVREWMVGKTDYDYCRLRGLDESLADRRRAFFNEVMATGVYKEWEEKMIDRQGKERYFLRRLFPLRNPDSGKITFLLGHGMEITERFKLLEKLNVERNFYQTVINAAPSLIFVKDEEGRFLLANQAMADLLGMTLDELISLNNTEVQEASAVLRSFSAVDDEVRVTGKPITIEESISDSSGKTVKLETKKLPLLHSDGRIAVLGISNDVTDRIQKEKALRLSEFRLNQAQELTRSGSWNWNLSNRKLEWSLGMYRIFEIDHTEGLPSMEMLKDAFHPDDRRNMSDLIGSISVKPQTVRINCRIRLPSGEKHVDFMIQPVLGNNGQVEEFFGTAVDVSEQVHAEGVIRRQQQHLKDAQEIAGLGSFEFNPASGEITWSKGMYQIWEVDEGLKPRLDWYYNTVHEDDRDKVIWNSMDYSPLQGAFSRNFRIVTPSGKVKHLELHSKWQEDYISGGHLLIGTAQDVTERKVQEERLIRNERQLLEAQEIAKAGSWELEVSDRIIVKLTPGVYRIFDLDLQEPVPDYEHFFSFISPKDRPRVKQAFENMLVHGLEQEFQYELSLQSGRRKIGLTYGKPVKDEHGRVIKAFGTTTDITERYFNEERLKISEQGLRLAQSIARIGSFTLELDEYKADWSEEMYKIWEIDQEDEPMLFEESLSSFLPEDRKRVLSNISRLVESGEEIADEFGIRVKSGLKQIEIRARLWRDEEGVAQRIFGTVMDITDRKRYEEELLRARTEAEESYRAKENFLANLSHELRTPLNGIIGMARLLKKTNLNSTQREYADVLNQTAGNLLMIINDILDFAKLQSGNLELEQVVFNPAQVADTAVQLQMFKAEEKNITLRHLHKGERPMPDVIGDPFRLSQILLNLLNNAVKFTNFGEIVLTHLVEVESEEAINILFCVEDTGIGIPHHLSERIFESFTQVHEAERSRGGVGLGLAITRHLVQQHGGDIWMESEPDIGSRFYFRIAYRKADQNADNNGSGSGSVIPDKLRILLAEDNKVNQFITESMLAGTGAVVDIANNGNDALELAGTRDYDIILMDIQMPVMDGLEAARRIRTLSERKRARVPIIALTANTARQAHRNLVSAGMNDWLVKPFTENSLFRKIGAQLKERREFSGFVRTRKFPQRRQPSPDPPQSSGMMLYDLTMLMKDMPGNSAFKKRMLDIFIENIPPIVDAMQICFINGDYEELSALAHKIKPTIDGSGILVLKETIRNIEMFREKKRTREQLSEDLSELKEVILRVVNAFRQEIAAIDAGITS